MRDDVRRLICMGAVFVSTLVASGCTTTPISSGSSAPCEHGAYALADGRSLVVVGAADDPKALQYVLDGVDIGLVSPTAAGEYVAKGSPSYATLRYLDCPRGQVEFTQAGRAPLAGKRLAMRVRESTFNSGDVTLFGRLVTPQRGLPRSLVVFLQGSGAEAATATNFWQYAAAAHGVAAFVYDKRGTGRSTGQATANLFKRADDTTVAVEEARRLLGAKGPVGILGPSQGGWVAQLNGQRGDADFLIIAYGLAEDVSAQDRDEVLDHLRAAGYGEDVLGSAEELLATTARVVRSHWQDGLDEFAAVRDKNQGAPWIKTASAVNSYTGFMLRMSVEDIRRLGPQLDQGVSFEYQPLPVIRSIKVPQLWILGGSDHTAPSQRTLDILRTLQPKQPSLGVVVFSKADHGIIEKWQDESGPRRRFAPGYVDLVLNWSNSRRIPPLDGAEIYRTH